LRYRQPQGPCGGSRCDALRSLLADVTRRVGILFVADEAAALDTPTDAELAEYLAANDDACV
jgi:hypothetical protein